MAQKSILSFFKTADRTISDETKSSVKKSKKQSDEESFKSQQVAEDSPVKKGRNKRKVKCIESDDDSNNAPNEVMNGDSEENENDLVEHKTNSRKSAEKISVQINDEKKVNGKSSKKPSKMKKTENVESEKQPVSPVKMEIDHSDQKAVEKSKTNDTIKAEPSCSTQNDVEFIPKRKTARKQMSSARNSKKNDVPIKVKIVEPKVENKETNNTENTSADKTVLENDKLTSEANEEPPEEAIATDNSENSNEEFSGSIELKDKSENNDNKTNKDEKSTSNSEEESESKTNSKKDASLKKKVKVSIDSSARKSTDGRLKANRKETKKNTSSKNSSKNDSIQSFFTPLKKSTDADGKENDNEDANKSIELKDSEESVEDKKNEAGDKTNGEHIEKDKKSLKLKTRANKAKDKKDRRGKDDVESEPVDNDDSPVKKVTRSRKKIQCLDSDEEDESKTSTASVKMEIDDTENKPDTSEEIEVTSTSNVKSESTASKGKTSPFKKEANATSKNGVGKKVFGVKSTSASGTVYDPSKNNYHPIEDACWKQNEKVPYLALAKTLELIENTSGRLKTIEILSNFLRSVIVLSPNDLLQSIYLCLNRLAPEYEGIELGVGETLLMKAVAQATGRTLEKIKAEVAVKGDLGLVSESSRGNQRVMFAPPKLTVSSVFSKFLEIAKMSGNSVMSKKTDKIQSLFVACRDCEARYIIRSLSGKLRIGLAEQSVLTAIARAAVLTPPGQDYPPEVMDASKGVPEKKFKEFLDSQALILKTAYCECPNYDLVIPVLLKEGLAALPKCCQVSPGRPLKPMLAHPTAGIDIVLERFDKNAFTCEFKYDGERAQIHMTENGDVTIFSRNQENTTSKYPDIISRIPKTLKESTKSFILDSEAVAWDTETKQILPFQVLSTRKKKDAVESEIVVQVCIMAFDLLYLNGESLVKKPLIERRNLLHSYFQEVESEFMFAQYKDGNSAETMQEFLDESVKGNCEGLMVKALEVDASYEIAKRSHNWLKLKKDYLQGIGDTLDLVVIGGYFGKGKRTGNYGGFLLACYDEENEEFQSICKLGTGFKDENLEAHTEFLKKHIIKEPKSYYRFDHGLEPDEWFEAVQVWEIKCADLSISPVHKAAIGIVDPEKGISLRFPRFIRIRDDKTPENATISTQIAYMYQKQQQIQNTTNKNAKNDEDYY